MDPCRPPIEFEKFLAKIDEQVPDHLDVHLICDNCMHFTLTYSSHDFYNELPAQYLVATVEECPPRHDT